MAKGKVVKEDLEDQENQEVKKGGGKGLVIVLVVVVALLMIGVGVMTYLLMSSGEDKGAAVNDSIAGQEATFAGHAKQYPSHYKQFDAPSPEAVPSYFIMDKFVVNFNGNGQAKYLAVDLQFMSYYDQLVKVDGAMENLRPILKNDIQRLLRNQHFNELDKPDGPEVLRAEILEVARKVLEKHDIYPELIEDVYMTRFVMQ